PSYNSALSSWINTKTIAAQTRLLANISPAGASAGAVAAATSTSNPNYWFHWTRDAGITLHEVSIWLNSTTDSATTDAYKQKLNDYSTFSRQLQTTSSTYGIGTAKYYMNGAPFTGAWCMPQRDSPAMRAVSLIGYARYLLSKGEDVSVYYDRKLPTTSIIKTDLEYVASNWNADNNNCDIWEEVRGNHFYTRMIQRRALIEGAQLASQLNDPGAAVYYNLQAGYISGNMTEFWSSTNNYIQTTIDYSGGLDYKASNLDSQVFLAALHSGLDDGFYTVESDQMLSTIVAIINAFQPLYGINSMNSAIVNSVSMPISVALGRYPEDKYTGYNSNGPGNPWSLITSGMAEYHYRLIETWSKDGSISVTSALSSFLDQLNSKYKIIFTNSYAVGTTYFSGSATYAEILSNLMLAGDMYMACVAFHTDSNGQMYEEWNLNTGYGQGAVNLTWSYGAHTAAARHRA
ncbi:Six-hairpin glycosidase-like protein, partial [Coemansia spiralis]